MSTPGDIIDGRFELLARLGSGGMGTVWRARDTALHREVALKEVRPPDPALTGACGDVLRERVLREARALARLSHPHVVTVHHIVDVGPHPWIVMELLAGPTLQDRLNQGPLNARDTARMGRQILSALSAAHAAGIQHRDVKPANVMLRADGSAVLTDFGIAALQGSTSLTATGDLIGSPEYIAPERIRGTDDDPASDLWSLGLVLYVAVEGVSPLRRATTLATLAAVLDDPVPPPVRSGPLAPVLGALLVRDPAARPDAVRLDAMLAQVEAGTSPQWAQPTQTAHGPSLPPPPPRPDEPRPGVPPMPRASSETRPQHQGHPEPRNRTPVIVAVIAVAVAIVAATALVFVLRNPDGDGKEAGSNGDKGNATCPSGPDCTTGPPQDPPTTPPPTTPPTTTPPTTTPPESSPPPVDEVANTWVAQLGSFPKASGTGPRDRAAAALRAKGAENVRHLDSSAYGSLQPGYWVLYSPGFGNGEEAVSYCQGIGLTSRDQCVGRFISKSGTDFKYQCYPTPSGGTTGRCTRP